MEGLVTASFLERATSILGVVHRLTARMEQITRDLEGYRVLWASDRVKVLSAEADSIRAEIKLEADKLNKLFEAIGFSVALVDN